MSNIYVNITDGASTGTGTQVSPYNYEQMVNFFNPDIVLNGDVAVTSAINGDIVNVKGQRYTDLYSNIMVSLFQIHDSLEGSISLRGWDIETQGSPVVYNDSANYFSLIDRYDYLTSGTLNIEIKDFIFESDNALYMYDYIRFFNSDSTVNLTLKDVILNTTSTIGYSQQVGGSSSVSADDNLTMYGCTLDASSINIKNLNSSLVSLTNVSVYDSVLMTDNLDIRDFETLIMSNNISNVENFSDNIYDVGNVTGYVEPTYNSNLINYDKHTDGADAVSYYTTNENLRYTDFNVPENGGAITSFRVSNDYNTGLFGNDRLSFGAYYFIDSNDIPDNRGHIGAFYFGGEYTNGEGTFEPAVVDFNIIASASVDTVANGLATITFNVANDIAIAFDPFAFDFSGTPLSGGSPLCVKYHAYNYGPRGRFEGLWEAVEFRWWFDYETSGGTNDYISCATDTAEHLYCGIYGDEYDVRLCIIYEPINT